MLAKITSKNQLTLPKVVVDEVGPTEYFDVEVRHGQILLTPVRIQRGDAVRAKLAALGLTDADVQDAVGWARSDVVSRGVAVPRPGYAASGSRSQSTPANKKSAKRK